jgi:hypothetical protein
MAMLTVADIPDEYRKGESDGENIGRLASGVGQAISDAFGERGIAATNRLVRASFLFRSSEIGRAMISRDWQLMEPLAETAQLVNFAGSALAASTLVGTIDLAAAAFYRLFVGQFDPADPGREADLGRFRHLDQIPAEAREWVEETKGAHGWRVLKGVRDELTHRWAPMHVTIFVGVQSGPLHHIEIDGERKALPEFLDESRTFVIDRFVAAGLILDRHAEAATRPQKSSE